VRIGKIAKELGFKQVSLSHEIMSRVKLVKRGQTCCVDAYLNPHIQRYIEGFKEGFDSELLKRVQVFFM
jgi:5-oxoprolinase (ATP-hydrolysing)